MRPVPYVHEGTSLDTPLAPEITLSGNLLRWLHAGLGHGAVTVECRCNTTPGPPSFTGDVMKIRWRGSFRVYLIGSQLPGVDLWSACWPD